MLSNNNGEHWEAELKDSDLRFTVYIGVSVYTCIQAGWIPFY